MFPIELIQGLDLTRFDTWTELKEEERGRVIRVLSASQEGSPLRPYQDTITEYFRSDLKAPGACQRLDELSWKLSIGIANGEPDVNVFCTFWLNIAEEAHANLLTHDMGCIFK